MLDLVIRGGAVADGLNGPLIKADVGVEDGRIAAVGNLAGAGAGTIIDATGLLVAPGFIDIHSHSDFTLLVDPRAQSQVFQGVTTEVVGNCGHGCAPITDAPHFAGNIYGYSKRLEISWRTFAGYLLALEASRPAVNVASLVPNGNLRLAVMDDQTGAATNEQTRRMCNLLQRSLEEGAWGFSTGLEYPAESAASPEELAALCAVTARYGGICAAHTRNREVSAVEAVVEAIRTVKSGGGPRLQVSHIIPRRGGPPGSREKCIAEVEGARAEGIDAAFDSHTRLHGITNLSNALPPALLASPGSLRDALNDPHRRVRLKRHQSIISSFGLGGWERVFLFTSPARPELAGKSLAELAGADDPWDAIFNILLLHAEDPHAPLCLCHSYEESEIVETMAHQLCTVGSDATALGVDGPLAGETFLGAFTWAGWYWRKMVREHRRMSPEAAVARLTSAPARRMGFQDRGSIEVGKAADIVVFDASTFRDLGTLESPNSLATGVRHLVVNGVLTIQNGALTGKRGGKVLRKGA